ncbi:MAG: hypothetical protein K8S87_11835 [Planctomycetes bacterium]|nr:hypothetical protein [Planctomycetota bacterium]
MKPKRIHTLIEHSALIANEFTSNAAKTQRLYENANIIAGFKGHANSLKHLLARICQESGIKLDFFDEQGLKQKIFSDESVSAALFFQNLFPPLQNFRNKHVHWAKFRHDDWVRQRINYSFINSANLGTESYSPMLELAEILRMQEILGNCSDKNFTLLFVPDKPESPVSAHSAIIAAVLLDMHVNLMLPESHPLDFEVVSKAETLAFRKNKNFRLFPTPNPKVLEESDVILRVSWAQLADDYKFHVQMNLFNEMKKSWNENLIPDNSKVLRAFSYPHFTTANTAFIEQALRKLLNYLMN